MHTTRARRGDAGFSLTEVLIAMAIMMLVLAGTFSSMTQAMSAQESARQLTGMNNNLRTAMDLIVRDLIQVGQGLPTGRVVGIPNGAGAALINRPGVAPGRPVLGACDGVSTFPAEPSLPAVAVGPDLGPPVDGRCTDVITTLSADGSAEGMNVSSIAANGRSLTIHPNWLISDDPDVDSDNLRPGELLMIRKGSSTVLMQITAVAGQTVRFDPGAAGDPLGLNQFDAPNGIAGTINRLKAEPTPDGDAPFPDAVNPNLTFTEATRIRMITYYVSFAAADPTTPRLMRIVNSGIVYDAGGAVVPGTPNADTPGNVVGFDVQSLRLSYDIVDTVNNWTGLRMDDADIGTCDGPCSPNQIRKVNVVLAGRSHHTMKQTGDYFRNTLFTQVSLRSLAFVDRY